MAMDWLSDEEARDLLRVSADNDTIIKALRDAIPQFIETQTGYPAEHLESASPDPLAAQLARFVLQLWYNPDGTDSEALTRVVESLAKTLRAMMTSEDD